VEPRLLKHGMGISFRESNGIYINLITYVTVMYLHQYYIRLGLRGFVSINSTSIVDGGALRKNKASL
jgi:hypothetical protein